MTTTVNFGVILVINGEDVAIEPAKAVTDAKKNGVEFSLPRRVKIGTAAELGVFLQTLTDDGPVSLPSGDKFPSPLDKAYGKLNSLNLAVEELNLKFPPSKNSENPDTPAQPTFTLGLSATWSDNETFDLIAGKLAIKGLYVKMTKT